MDTNSIIIFTVIALAVLLVIYMADKKGGTLKNIKAKPTGDGQYGTSRWATSKEIAESFTLVNYTSDKWRKGEDLPKYEGLIISGLWDDKSNRDDSTDNSVAYNKYSKKKIRCRVDCTDSHTLLISTTGGGKTTAFLYPNLEYCCATGMSFFTTDTKGDVFRDYALISEKYYGYQSYIIDLRNALKSHNYNLLQLTNKYMDLYASTGNIAYQARAERYAKIISKTIINGKGFEGHGGGQNAYFYDAAEGLITSVILLVSELCPNSERHIVSVFKLINELMEIDPDTVPKNKDDKQQKPKNYFHKLMKMIPDTHKAKWFAGSALSAPQQQMSSVMTTAMSRLLSFIDSELEQIICFDSKIDAEYYCQNKTSVFLVFPENDTTKHFMVSLFINQFYNECIEYANNHNNRLDKRTYFFLDEVGTIPKIEAASQMFSAGRSRGILQVPMIQSLSQFDRNYGREESKIIQECCQNVLFGGLTPLSSSAKDLSQMLGTQTVQVGSVSRGAKHSNSTSYQMHGKPLMSEDEIRRMPKYNFVFSKTGMASFKTRLRRSPYWGINLENDKYVMETTSLKQVSYATRTSLLEATRSKYGTPIRPIIEDINKKSLSQDLF